MARSVTGSASIEQKIEKAQQTVIKAKAKYDAAITELKKLMDKRDACRRDEIIAAIAHSDKSYDEIIAFITSDSSGDE
jgi:flagellar biosynthesis chaperone FliJ